MLQHVALVRPDFSEERTASIIRVERISKVGTTLAITGNSIITFICSVLWHLIAANVVASLPIFIIK
jgi:hypothetical protein